MSAAAQKPDPSQRAADPHRSAWVSANAGAGKTYTLANRVTRLLLAGARPERILCLTYTKAAAAEMAARLFNQLGAWALMADDTLREKIREIGASADSGEELARARTLFAQALETPGGLKIQTIHAFCQNLLARFPLEAAIAPGFTVLDEQTAQHLMQLAQTFVLEHAEDNLLLTGAIHTIVTEAGEQQLQQVLDAALGVDRRRLEAAISGCTAEDGSLFHTLSGFHGSNSGERPDAVVRNFCDGLKRERETIAAIATWLESGGKTDRNFADAFHRILAVDFTAETFETTREIFLTKEDKPRAKLASKKLSEARPDLADHLNQMAQRFYEAEEARRAARAATLCEAAILIANATHTRYTALKAQRAALDYDDLIAKTQRLLERRDAAAWVLYRLDGGLDHILIDEAQDTSPEQWAILKKLTEDFFAGESARKTDALARTIFAVGDEKQSIFSFQGADPVQFDVPRHYFWAHVSGAGQDFADEQLQTSRRSAPEILGFVDDVFGAPETRDGLTPDGHEIVHFAHRAEARGLVEFWPTVAPDDEEEPDPWQKPVDAPSKRGPVVRLAEKIARQIRFWMDARVTLPGHEDPISPGDIMILLPRREPFGSEIIRQLKLLHIPVAGADRLRLTTQIAVMDLIALGRFMLQPQDDLTLAAILRSPLMGVCEDDLCDLSTERTGTLWAALNAREGERPQFAQARELLSDLLARADFVQPYEFYAHVLNRTRARFLARLGAEANDAIEEFLSLAISYEAANTPSLQGFLQWLEQGNPEIKRDMERGRGEVRVMTVHGAKGLEADIVILPDTARKPKQPSQLGRLLFSAEGVVFSVPNSEAPQAVKAAKQAAQAEALREHRRLLYVALTRAKDRLYFCGFENKKGIDPDSWYRTAEPAAQKGVAVERDGETIYLRGVPDAAEAEKKAAEPLPSEIPAWALTPPRGTQGTAKILRPSDTTDEEQPAFSPRGDGGMQRFRRGNLIHTMLARLPEIAAGERPAVAEKFLAARGVPPDEAGRYIEETLRILDDPVFATAFGPGSRAEVPLIADLPELGPGILVHGRIDRLAITGTEAVVIDFKTNRPPPAREEDVAPIYLRQMALYRAALRRIVPGRPIVAGLLWTDGPRLMRLSDALLDRHLTAAGKMP
ncbi:MAG: double-strand break repair helicase AddA [Alphaproteobacteria bacterium 62-8]|nr:MAG: double-strand break repair helicase AddA [Alphaproteobacteria bacterium 62-8]